MLKTVIISDTHNMLNQISTNIPEGDVLIHCGDWTLSGAENEMVTFRRHLRPLEDKFKHILLVAGNHDQWAELNPQLAKKLFDNDKIKYLKDEAIVIDGVKFYGSPWVPYIGPNWAFQFPRNDVYKEADAVWSGIPDDTQVLITHAPPRSIMDNQERHYGCPYLLMRLYGLHQLKYHLFGHIHSDYGQMERNGVRFINAATCTEEYEPLNPPVLIHF